MKKTLYFESTVVKEVNTSTESKGLRIRGYANTVNKDRAGDIIVPNAWVNGVSNYRRNPVLLNQHKKDQPIGKVEKIFVNQKGIFVEAYISDAAEKNYGIQSLIKDGALKAFSVGFRPRPNGVRFDKKRDVTYITDLELLEISIVSVPANQDSLFSVKKSFDGDESFEEFIKSLDIIDSDEISIEPISLKAGISSMTNDHYHTFEVDCDGNGIATYTSHSLSHSHDVKEYEIQESDKHVHTVSNWIETEKRDFVLLDDAVKEENSEGEGNSMITEEVIEKIIEEVKEESLEDDKEIIKESLTSEVLEKKANTPTEPVETSTDAKENKIDEEEPKSIPLINLLSVETSMLDTGKKVNLNGLRYVVKEIATNKDSSFILREINVNNEELDSVLKVPATELSVLNGWELGTKFDIHLGQHLASKSFTDNDRALIRDDFESIVNMTEIDLYSLKEDEAVKINPENQEKLNKILNLVSMDKGEWTDTNYIVAKRLCETIKLTKDKIAKTPNRDFALSLSGHKIENSIKETKIMGTQNVGDPLVVPTSASKKIEEVSAPIEVKEPRVAELVKEAGKAIMDDASNETIEDSERVKELKAEISKYQNQVTAMTNEKLHFQDSQRNAQKFTDMEMANAVYVAKALGKIDVFDTKLGMKMKAVTSVDALLSNFSKTVYDEMQQQLVIAPMLNRMPVDAKSFRVPVADEDTDGDVAQFASGTYATGAFDTTRVPATNQHAISAVEFTPHKFMATTHLAKDEAEDTVIPLVDFLRAAAARRIARAIDKALLRGDGTLSGFNASPTNAISAGAGYASVFKGIATLANDIAALQVDSGSATQATPANIASARAKLGKYGLQLGDQLTYLTTIEGYNELVQTSDFRTVDKFGPNATYLTGSLGAVYGMPVMITEFLDNKGTSTDMVGLLIYKPGFLVAERRGMEIESEYNPRQQVTAIYMSTRFDMKPLTTVAGPALSSQYSFASVIRSV